jgi:hypothetical protein
MFEALTVLEEKQKKLREEFKTEGEAAVKAALREFFEAYPEVEGVRWHQYTPYFNDGDPCVFSVNEPDIRLVGDEEWADAWSFNYAVEKGERAAVNPQLLESFKALSKMLQELDAVLEQAFGDHAEVAVTREGLTIEEYEHD